MVAATTENVVILSGGRSPEPKNLRTEYLPRNIDNV